MVVKNFNPPSDEQIARWRDAVHQTWQAIGHDCINAVGEDVGGLDALELTLDADHVRTYGHLKPDDYQEFNHWVAKIMEVEKDFRKAYKRIAKDLNWGY